LGLKCDIKFVNDVFLNNKKISGVHWKGEINDNNYKLELGICVNLNTSKEDNLDTATSYMIETGKQLDVHEFFNKLTRRLCDNIKEIED
jgi:biotin-(acetyl-CoA carboxylase) ligase